MSVGHFSSSTNVADRRRRRLVTEIEPDIETPETDGDTIRYDIPADVSPFPLLSRDRLVRRVISPRLWKHVTIAIVLTLTPIIYAVVTWPSSYLSDISEQTQMTGRLDALRGLSGLKLFVAAQFCLVIAWVRSASAVDFRGRYRWWRWMAVGLFATSLVFLTDTSELLTHLTAQGLKPLFGPIEAARPALILVPAGACLAFVLHRVIPDMGRCRLAQSLLVLATFLLVARAFAGARLHSPSALFHLSTLELLISGLMLSAFQLHARFVIHVNPDPPLAVQRKSAVTAKEKSSGSPAENVPTAAIVANQLPPLPAEQSRVATAIENVATPTAQPHRTEHETDARTPDETASNSSASSQNKNKSGKKQKYRKAG